MYSTLQLATYFKTELMCGSISTLLEEIRRRKHCNTTVRWSGNTTKLSEHLISCDSDVYKPTAWTSKGNLSISSFFQQKINQSDDKSEEITAHNANVCIRNLRPSNTVKDAGFRNSWQPIKLQYEKRPRQLVMLWETAGILALISELEILKSDVSITSNGWTSMAQDSYCKITGGPNT